MRALPEGFRQKDNGQYEYRFTCAGRRRSVSGSTIRECKAKAEEMRAKGASGLLVDKNRVTLAEYAKEVIDRAQVKLTTKTSYRHWIAMLPTWILDMKLQKIERRHIMLAQTELSKRASISTCNSVLNLLRQISNEAILDQIVLKSPCLGVKSMKDQKVPARDTIHRALTPDEQKRLFDEMRRCNCWYLEMFEFQLLTGMRIGEATALHWADVTGSAIRVHATMSAGVYTPTTKTDSSRRDIPLTPTIRKVLHAQREKAIRMHGVGIIAKDKPVFCPMVSSAEYVNRGALNSTLSNLCDKVGIDRISTHAFRDTFATRAIEQGMQPNTLKELLGHSSITTTMDIYAHVLPDTKSAAMQALDIVL